VAPTTPLLTHSIYADDLVIFAKADTIEVQELKVVMDHFAKCSGLKINP
jgi:hypothetical protein